MGVLLPVSIFFILFIEMLKEKNYLKHIKIGAILLITTSIILYVTWPFLWRNPIDNFIFAFKNMSKFRWDGTVLFNGEFVKATEIKWNYIPVWFSITTPITFLLILLNLNVLLELVILIVLS